VLWEILGYGFESVGGPIVGYYPVTYLTGIADLKETRSSIEDCGMLARWSWGDNTVA
jgi:hypothetical protein